MTRDNDDVQQVAGTLIEQVAAQWNAQDAEAYAALFDADADFVDVLGRRIKGREAIERIHRRNFATIHLNSRVSMELLAVRELSDNVALVHVHGAMDIPAGPLAGTNTSTQTWILANTRGAWRITAFHNTLVRDMPGIPGLDDA
jgi:uncharacterized protein (TIGR02246 family)